VGAIKETMIRIVKYTISSNERREKQAFKDVEITPSGNIGFEFANGEDVQKFEDELRQTFEIVFPFGCSITSER